MSTGKLHWGNVTTGCSQPLNKSVLPIINISINGVRVKALVDSGCEQSVIMQKLVEQLGLHKCGPDHQVIVLNGCKATCKGETSVVVDVSNDPSVKLKFLFASQLVANCSVILGMTGISKLGGMIINACSEVEFAGGMITRYASNHCENGQHNTQKCCR